MQDIEWEFAVIRSQEPNAFVAPGGKVVVFSGLLDMVGSDDDQLAAVLAHEAGHTLARHVVSCASSVTKPSLQVPTLAMRRQEMTSTMVRYKIFETA